MMNNGTGDDIRGDDGCAGDSGGNSDGGGGWCLLRKGVRWELMAVLR